jgi:hypothetical protein
VAKKAAAKKAATKRAKPKTAEKPRKAASRPQAAARPPEPELVLPPPFVPAPLAETAPDAPKGILCRGCGGSHMSVSYTRPRRNQIMRVRVCRFCGKRHITREKPG